MDDLTLARDALESIPIAADSAARAHHYLNKWIQLQGGVEIDEKLDPMIDNLPQSYRSPELPRELKRRVVATGDIFFLLQCFWMRDVASRVASQPANSELVQWLAEREQELGIDDTEKLALAERLFDWTVRNIQLDPLPPPPAPPKATTGASDPASMRASLPAPLRGELGPGYSQLPWQTLVYGHGDAWERSRVFILLCRQAGLDVVMLALPQSEGTGGSRPWLAALILRDQLYLFDSSLGLPIPGPGGRGIATLEHAVADSAILESLHITGELDYPVSASDLSSVSALVDAELASMSIRMRLLEPALADKRKLVLTTHPSELAKSLRQCKHISGVSIWRVAIEAEFYQSALPFVLQSDPARAAARSRQLQLFEPSRPLMYARHLDLQGVYETSTEDESQLGARERYSRLRLSEKEIDSLEDSRGREIVGLGHLELSTEPEQRAKDLANMMAIVRTGKHDATYWIALSHAESGNYPVAIEWLRDRVLAGSPDSPWHHGARYNLARCYEALGQRDDARRIYISDESPQRHGNLLRAAMLAAGSRASVKPVEPPTKDTTNQ